MIKGPIASDISLFDLETIVWTMEIHGYNLNSQPSKEVTGQIEKLKHTSYNLLYLYYIIFTVL